jgi:hypothetical protein
MTGTIDEREDQNMYSPLFMMSPMSPGAATENRMIPTVDVSNSKICLNDLK